MTGTFTSSNPSVEGDKPGRLPGRGPLLIVLLLSLVYILAFRFEILTDRYVLGGGDIDRAVYWMQKWQNPALFSDDPVSDYLESIQPVGMVALYRVIGIFQNPVDAARWVPILLFLVSIFLLFKLGEFFGGRIASVTIVLAFLGYEGNAHIFSSGSASDFLAPIFLGLIYCILTIRRVCAALLLLMSVLFYPPSFLMGAAIWTLWNLMLIFRDRTKENRAGRLISVFLVPVPAGLFLVVSKLFSNGRWGEVLSRSEMQSLPQFGPGGVEPFVNLPFFEWISGGRSGFDLSAASFLLILFAILTWIPTRKAPTPQKGFITAGIGVCLGFFALAHIVAVRIGFPTNYVRYTIPLFLILWTGANVQVLAFGQKAGRLLVALWIVMFGAYACTWSAGTEDHRGQRELFQFLQSLPETALIAGHPMTMEGAGALTQRKIFISRQADGGLHKKYLEMYENRIKDFFAMYDSKNRDSFCELAQRNRIDYFVVDKEHFAPKIDDHDNDVEQPYQEMMTAGTRQGDDFYVLNRDDKKILFEDGQLVVFAVNCNTLP